MRTKWRISRYNVQHGDIQHMYQPHTVEKLFFSFTEHCQWKVTLFILI